MLTAAPSIHVRKESRRCPDLILPKVLEFLCENGFSEEWDYHVLPEQLWSVLAFISQASGSLLEGSNHAFPKESHFLNYLKHFLPF